MAVNKVIYGGRTLIDLTGDTVTADKLLTGFTAHDKSGAVIEGKGLFGNPARHINALQYLGIGLVLPGVVCVNL